MFIRRTEILLINKLVFSLPINFILFFFGAASGKDFRIVELEELWPRALEIRAKSQRSVGARWSKSSPWRHRFCFCVFLFPPVFQLRYVIPRASICLTNCCVHFWLPLKQFFLISMIFCCFLLKWQNLCVIIRFEGCERIEVGASKNNFRKVIKNKKLIKNM